MLIIFDCDGVLIDSEIIASRLDAEAMTRLGRPTQPVDISMRFTGMPHRDMWKILETELDAPLPADFFDLHLAEQKRRFATELKAIDGVRAAVSQLNQRICVASSTRLPSLRVNLETAGLLDLFDPHIFSASQAARGKPAPDVFLFAASQMGADPAECLIIEDSVAGVTAAGRAGMAVIGFTGGAHADPALATRLRAAGARATFAEMTELGAYVDRHLPA